MAVQSHIGYVTAISSDMITVEIADDVATESGDRKLTRQQTYERAKDAGQLQIGNYLKIRHGNNRFVLATIIGLNSTMNEREADRQQDWEFAIHCQPVGSLELDGTFSRRASRLPIPRELVFPVDAETIHKIYLKNEQFSFHLGQLSTNNDISVYVDGDKFFSKHVAVVGSTGSGKSSTVAKILHEAVGISSQAKNVNRSEQKNSHVILFDLHAEYESAFTLDDCELFNLNTLSVDSLVLPYWLMNSEELESMFIESSEQHSHNQVAAFKKAVIENKKRHNPGSAEKITYDSPVYFSLQEVFNYINNLNNEVISGVEGEVNFPKLSDKTVLDGTEGRAPEDHYFDSIQTFVPLSGKAADKATKGTFKGEFSRFISRFESRMNDARLAFLMSPKKEDGNEYKTDSYGEIVRQYIGYLKKSNVTIVDLSGIPFEVLSTCVSLISRVVFDFCFHYTKVRQRDEDTSDVPVMIVCEEAHNYVPNHDSAMYRPSKKSIERIAKEGRKYGLSLLMVSQRPSEVSETVFAQCNNFIALRLTNRSDQIYVTHLLPDHLSSVTDMLPSLGDGECIAIGDAVPLPSVVQMDMPEPAPKSQTVRFHHEWRQNWVEDKFKDVIKRLMER